MHLKKIIFLLFYNLSLFSMEKSENRVKESTLAPSRSVYKLMSSKQSSNKSVTALSPKVPGLNKLSDKSKIITADNHEIIVNPKVLAELKKSQLIQDSVLIQQEISNNNNHTDLTIPLSAEEFYLLQPYLENEQQPITTNFKNTIMLLKAADHLEHASLLDKSAERCVHYLMQQKKIKKITGDPEFIKKLNLGNLESIIARKLAFPGCKAMLLEYPDSLVYKEVETKSAVEALRLNKDGSRLCTSSGGRNGNIMVWDTATHKLIVQLPDHAKTISDIRFNKDSSLLYSCSWDKTIKIWNMDNFNCIATLTSDQELNRLSLSSDEKYLASGGWQAHINVWDLPTKKLIAHIPTGIKIKAITFGNDYIVYITNDDSQYNTIKALCVLNGLPVDYLVGHKGMVTVLHFDAKRAELYSGSRDKTIKVWNKNNTCIATLDCLTPVSALGVSEHYLYATCTEKIIKIWDKEILHCINTSTFKAEHDFVNFTHSLCVSPDESRLYTSHVLDGKIRIWDLEPLHNLRKKYNDPKNISRELLSTARFLTTLNRSTTKKVFLD